MKALIFAVMMAATLPVAGQNFFLQLQPEAGFSSFTSGILPYELRSSYQMTFAGGIELNDRSSLRLGVGVQQSGARSSIAYNTMGIIIREKLYHTTYFIKIPVDYSISLARSGLFTLDIGAYLNLNITSQVVEWGAQNDYLAITEEQLTRDDVGLRLRPAVAIPVTQRYTISLGVLQEFGLVAFVRETHHYNTYFTAGVKLKI